MRDLKGRVSFIVDELRRCRITDQASAALKGAAERAGPEKVEPDGTAEIETEPFNVRLHAVARRRAILLTSCRCLTGTLVGRGH